MIELSFDYLNKLAAQNILIVSILCGFTLSVIISILDKKDDNRMMKSIFVCAVIATASFLVSIFANTKILMLTTEGYPVKVSGKKLNFPRILAVLTFLSGILSVLFILVISIWSKSKVSKFLAVIVGLVTLLLISLMIN